jgi:hypothetical protein
MRQRAGGHLSAWYLAMVDGTAGFSPRATAAAVASDSALQA